MTHRARAWSGAACAFALLQSPADSLISPVRIDAVIGDSRWIPIHNLRASDIELLEDGVPRRIESAELRTVPRRTSADTSRIETAADEERVAREPGARTFIFFLDEFHVSPGQSAERARLWMADFVDAKVYERDLALVVRPLDPIRSARFTRDHAVLHGTVAGFSGRKRQYEPRTPLEEQAAGRDPATVPAVRRRIVVDQLNDIARRLAELKADRPIVVIVSEGFPSSDQDLEPFLRASSAFHFTTYTINPALPQDDVAGPAERAAAKVMRQRIAALSGGLAVEADQIIMGFARVAHDSESYWALTYRPQRADGAFHAIEVRTKVPGSRVRARSGYWASPAGDWHAPPASSLPAGTMPGRRLRRNAVAEIWAGVSPDSGGGARMTITWEPKTTGAREPRSVAVKARTLDRRMLFDGAIARVEAQAGTEMDNARFSVPAGRVELDLTVLDANGAVLDTDAREVDVPDLRSSGRAGPVLLTPQVVRVRSPRELEQATANPEATPASLRTFSQRDSLLIRSAAFDASGAGVQVTARLLNQAGVPMRSLEAVAGATGVTQFALPLHLLASGQYVIELIGTNGNGVVSERILFRVTG
jgi:VWFA-related protein